MTIAEIHDQLIGHFGGDAIVGLHTTSKDPWIEVAPQYIAQVAAYLKSDAALAFDLLCNLSGVDYLEVDPKRQAKFPYEPHIEVVYHLYSVTHRHRLVVKVRLPRWKDNVQDQLPEIPSVSDVWAVADWHEREAFDLVGISFVGHPNLRRILCAEDWVGHPLRKDYVFPLEYHGIRGR